MIELTQAERERLAEFPRHPTLAALSDEELEAVLTDAIRERKSARGRSRRGAANRVETVLAEFVHRTAELRTEGEGFDE